MDGCDLIQIQAYDSSMKSSNNETSARCWNTGKYRAKQRQRMHGMHDSYGKYRKWLSVEEYGKRRVLRARRRRKREEQCAFRLPPGDRLDDARRADLHSTLR